ncbi:germ cell-specific gene 1-like protein [Astyanax mexicanus]|uniref:GSG1 like n=2 Tax=Astyanax mexicanus TaxID=7994 RepID=A0A3B1KEB9_ASTMX|nr:germ cell-specific gene 1-like protein [Astyanax mexicanus]
MMGVLSRLRTPQLSFLQTLLALALSTVALLSSHWCHGRQKVPKPLCSVNRLHRCTPVPGVNSNSSSFSWETGDDSFIFPTFHAGIWKSCEENIHTDAWEEKCRSFMALTPGSEKGIFWLCVGMELMYVSLLCISCLLLSMQLCLSAWWPLANRWGQLLNAYAAVFTVLGGLVGMVAHIMFMQVFQVTASSGPEDFKPHSYGYSWAFYMAWVAFTCCMSSGISTLNNYTKKELMAGLKQRAVFYPCKNFTFPPQPSQTPYYCPPPPPPPSLPPPSPPPPPPLSPLSPLSPYYCSPSPPSPPDDSSPPAPLSPYYTHPPPSPSRSRLHLSPSPSLSHLHSPASPSLSRHHSPASPSLSRLHSPASPSLSRLHSPASPSLSRLHSPASPSLSRLHSPASPSFSLLRSPPSPCASHSLLHSPLSPSRSLILPSPSPSRMLIRPPLSPSISLILSTPCGSPHPSDHEEEYSPL